MTPLTPEEWEEAKASFAASQARSDALLHQRWLEAGEFSIELIRVADDPPESSPPFQAELGEFLKSFRATSVTVSQRAIAFDSVDGGGHPIAVFVVGSLALPMIAAAAHVCATWVKARSGRKLRLKVGDVVAEGQTVEDIERLLKQAAELCAKKKKK
jgi:hypothetical protein